MMSVITLETCRGLCEDECNNKWMNKEEKLCIELALKSNISWCTVQETLSYRNMSDFCSWYSITDGWCTLSRSSLKHNGAPAVRMIDKRIQEVRIIDKRIPKYVLLINAFKKYVLLINAFQSTYYWQTHSKVRIVDKRIPKYTLLINTFRTYVLLINALKKYVWLINTFKKYVLLINVFQSTYYW
jgi:hypothetical protein